MKKLSKITLKSQAEKLNDNEMKKISGGYGTGGYGTGGNETWYSWKCWCKAGNTKFMMSGTWADVVAVAGSYCPTDEFTCDAQL